jgi:hypothetical protein
MTDLTPNDLSHLGDEEFNALCPQGEHAPGAEPLSPAAQAVLDAVNKELDETPWNLTFIADSAAAAALRAAAEEVVLPKYQYADWQMAHTIMEELQNIAAELENN